MSFFIFQETKIVADILNIIKQRDNTIAAIIFLAISLFIGFTLQATSSFLRKNIYFFDKKGFSTIVDKEDKIYKKAKERLNFLGLLRKDDREEVFHTMDNYIRAHINDDLIKTFNSRMSFWSNIALVAFITFLLSLPLQNDIYMKDFSFVLFILFFFSFFEYKENFRRTYDTVLKTFWSTLKINEKAQRGKGK